MFREAEKTALFYNEVYIVPHDVSPDLYVAEMNSSGWSNMEELLSLVSRVEAVGGKIYKLGEDDLPEYIEDIRGKIHNEPQHIFGYLNEDGNVEYFGFEKD